MVKSVYVKKMSCFSRKNMKMIKFVISSLLIKYFIIIFFKDEYIYIYIL